MGPTIDMLLFAGRMKTWAIANMFLLRFRYPSLAIPLHNVVFDFQSYVVTVEAERNLTFSFAAAGQRNFLPCVSCIVLSFWKFALFSLVCVFKGISRTNLTRFTLAAATINCRHLSKPTSGRTAEFTAQSQTSASRLKTLLSTTDSLYGRKGPYEGSWPKLPRRTR